MGWFLTGHLPVVSPLAILVSCWRNFAVSIGVRVLATESVLLLSVTEALPIPLVCASALFEPELQLASMLIVAMPIKNVPASCGNFIFLVLCFYVLSWSCFMQKHELPYKYNILPWI